MASARLTDRKRVFIHIVCIKFVQLSYCYWCCCCYFRSRRRRFQASGSAFSFGLLFVRERAQQQNCSFLTQRITGFLLAICWHYYYYFGAAWCRLLFFFHSIYWYSSWKLRTLAFSRCYSHTAIVLKRTFRVFSVANVDFGIQKLLLALFSTQISLLLYY